MGLISKLNTHIRSMVSRSAPVRKKIFLTDDLRIKIFSLFKKITQPRIKLHKKSEESLNQKTLTIYSMKRPPLDPDDAMELFEIARLFHEHKNKEATSRFNQIPEEQKNEVHCHLRHLGCKSPNLDADHFKTQQALFATAFQDSHYFSLRRLNRWFADLDCCMAVDNPQTKRAQLRT